MSSSHLPVRRSAPSAAWAAARALVALAALVAAAGAAAAQDAYDFVEPEWGLDFVRAGNPDMDANYAEIMGSGACVLDYDGDGWEDLFLVNGKYQNETLQEMLDPRSALYRNVEGTGFEKVPGALDVGNWWGLGCAVGDYDGDADADIAISGWGGTLLYRNDGGGAFTNVTAEAGVRHETCGDVPCFTHSLAFLDYDKDDDLDLYVLNYNAWDGVGVAVPLIYPGQCNVMWRNEGDGTFTNVTDETGTADCGLNHLAMAIADVDGDGWQDIFIASDETIDTLLMNNGDGTFRDVSQAAGVADRRGGMGASWGDYDGDGLYDLIITHYEAERFALYRQGPNLTFTDRAVADGLESTDEYVGWGTEFQDYDLDGDLDLIMVNGHVNMTYNLTEEPRGYEQVNLVFRNDGGVFTDVSHDVWHPQPSRRVSRGLATADFDRDGYLDVVVTNNANETAEVWRSTRGPNNFLSIRLAANSTMDPHALGAVVEVTAGGETLAREVVAATSYLSTSSRDLRFGLGDASRADSVVVRWPDGTRQEFTDVWGNRVLSLPAGGALATLREHPIAASSATRVVANRLDPVTLTGEVVRAPATVTREEWRVDGDVVDGSTLTRNFTTLGTRDAVYRVEDATGAWDEARVEISVENIPPTPAFSTPAETTRGVPLLLDGGASADRDGTLRNWTWTVEGREYTGVTATHTFLVLGTFEVTLTVEDDEGGTATLTRTVHVVNAPPTAAAGADRSVNVASTVTLDGSASADADGIVVAWSWDFGDGTTAEGETVEKQYATEGAYTVTLTVTDDDGATATDVAIVTAGELYPVARAGLDVPSADRVRAVAFDGSASHDPDGVLTSWRWEFGDGAYCDSADVAGSAEGCGAENAAPVAEHRYTTLGDFTATLTVTDDDGQSTSDSLVVRVRNLPPAVGALDPLEQEGLAPVVFSAGGSDPDGSIASWSWDFGDGVRGEGQEVAHAYLAYGRYAARLTVTDDEGLSVTVDRSVWLYARPVAIVGPDRVTDRITDLAVDGAASSDADGRIVEWRWDFGDGAECVIRADEGPGPECGPSGSPAGALHRYARLGAFTLTLRVVDDDGFVAVATATVTVENLPPVAHVAGYGLANVNQSLEWSGAASLDPDGDVVAWAWDFGSGAVAGDAVVEHAFAAAGAREARLTVTDSDGGSASVALPVEVVDRLEVTVEMERATYGPTDRPRGVATVLFANGLPASGAFVNVTVTYRVGSPHAALVPRPGVEFADVEGVADADGRLEFEVPPPLPRIADAVAVAALVPSTGGPIGNLEWAHHQVRADAAWRGNSGDAEARYAVTPIPGHVP